MRVGSLKKMSRKVLPYTLYEEEKDAIHELKRQLNSDELSVQVRTVCVCVRMCVCVYVCVCVCLVCL